jgi:hypothetical protein
MVPFPGSTPAIEKIIADVDQRALEAEGPRLVMVKKR